MKQKIKEKNMGYYSDVAIGMSKEDGERFLIEYEKLTSGICWLYSSAQIWRYSDCMVISWQRVKWYQKLPEVQWIHRFIEELAGIDHMVAYVRVGEAIEDCEELYLNDCDNVLWNKFGLNRSIAITPPA